MRLSALIRLVDPCLRGGRRFLLDGQLPMQHLRSGEAEAGLQTGLQLGIDLFPVPSPATALTRDNARLLPVAVRHFRPFFALVMRRSGVRFSSQAPCL